MSRRDEFINPNYFIVLALAEGSKHGLAIQEQIAGDGVGLYLRTSTIYAALKVLEQAGMIEPVGGAGVESAASSTRRKAYQLTEKGRRKLEQEARTYKRSVELAQQRLPTRL